MKKLITLLAIVLAFGANAQVSINAGTSMLVGFNSPGPWGGVHLGLEIPRSDAVALFGKLTHFVNRRDPVYEDIIEITVPGQGYPDLQTVRKTPWMNITVLEGGTRYYLGNGFDYGFAAYGGSSVKLVFSSAKVRYEDLDGVRLESLEGQENGTIFSLGFGIGGGVKYSTGRFGTFYLDAGVSYMIFNQASQNNVSARMFNPLLFDFSLGWRKDLRAKE
ncbi:MAG: hypothetical protein QNK23_03095 [Crocinitomicaceae bacterium]|nr:hypothetical protein [Crocinitomicaceae bacterium]